MGFITRFITYVIALVIALVIVQIIFNPSSLNILKMSLANIGANAKSLIAPSPQNEAVANCTANVNSAMKILADKWFPNTQLSIVNISIFTVNNTGPKVTVFISEPTLAVLYNAGMNVTKDNLTTKINAWISQWAFETGEPGGINCYKNFTRAGSYVCRDLEYIALSNASTAIGEVVRIAGSNYNQEYSIVLPVLCNSNGVLLPNSKRLLISGNANGDYLDG